MQARLTSQDILMPSINVQECVMSTGQKVESHAEIFTSTSKVYLTSLSRSREALLL